jgi:hypothetical protein
MTVPPVRVHQLCNDSYTEPEHASAMSLLGLQLMLGLALSRRSARFPVVIKRSSNTSPPSSRQAAKYIVGVWRQYLPYLVLAPIVLHAMHGDLHSNPHHRRRNAFLLRKATLSEPLRVAHAKRQAAQQYSPLLPSG